MQNIALQTTGIHHLALRSTHLARAHAFYGRTLGLPIVLETWDWFAALAGETVLIVRGPETRTPPADRFDPFRVGLDHVALACRCEAELTRVVEALATARVPSTDIRFDPVLQRRYVAFKDPDGIAWEFYMDPVRANERADHTSYGNEAEGDRRQ